MDIDHMSSSQVLRICELPDGIVANLQARDLSKVAYPYVWLDAIYVKCRNGSHVSSCALATATDSDADSCRKLLRPDTIDTESYAGWLSFLRSLHERGVQGVLCVASDAHEELRRVIEEVFPGVTCNVASYIL